MDIGPTSDGRIVPIFEERLYQIGTWLRHNGEAIFGTKPWIYQNDTYNSDVWYTSKVRKETGLDPHRKYNKQTSGNAIVYAVVLKWPKSNLLKLGSPRLTPRTRVTMLGYDGNVGKIKKMSVSKGITVDLRNINWLKLPSHDAWTFKLEYLAADKHNPFEN